MDKKITLNVRSSAAEFLIFSLQKEADTIEGNSILLHSLAA